LPDTLQRVGLRSLLTDYFSPVEISLFSSFDAFLPTENEYFDLYFTLPDIFAVQLDFFLSKRTKTICIINKCIEPGSPAPVLSSNRDTLSRSYGLTVLQSTLSQEAIIDQLHAILREPDRTAGRTPASKNLSTREREVLKLIVAGMINKEIADKLFISLNTVLSHRKNITAKLGIKTVPGLTFYAIANGLITNNENEQ